MKSTHRMARAALVSAALIANSAFALAQQPVEVPPPSQSPPWKIVNQRGQEVECDTSPWQKVDLGTVSGVHIYSGDHCSMPSPDPLSNKFKQVFSHACDLHDICYLTPGNTKSYCDDLVKWRWDRDCEHAYASTNPLGRQECKVASQSWRTGLNTPISGKYWDYSQTWGRQHCHPTATANPAERAISWVGIQSGPLPSGAIRAAGMEAVCRVQYQGGWHAGRVVGANCDIGYGGREMQLPEGQALVITDSKTSWVAAGPNGEIPPQAVIAGTENGQPRAVCRANAGPGMHAGKTVGGYCNIGFEGRELTVRPFQVLTYRN